MHLVVDVSAHGYGHFAQTAPVLNALWRRRPDLRVTLRSTLPAELLASRLEQPVDHREVDHDFGMVMTSALDVDRAASLARYRDFHRDWGKRVDQAARDLDALRPDLLLANVPYLSLAAAGRAGVPAAALCSLNWAAIFAHYFPDEGAIVDDMLGAYARARVFLRPEPSMPMPGLSNTRDIAPIARRGRRRRQALDEAFGLGPEERLVLVAPGGIPTAVDMARWPRRSGLRWVVPPGWGAGRDDVIDHDAAGMGFTDLLCSCDVLVTKPGYGSVTEAVCNGVPVIYVRRGDWPEEPALVAWLQGHGRSVEITREQWAGGEVLEALERLENGPPPQPVMPGGAEEAAEHLLGMKC